MRLILFSLFSCCLLFGFSSCLEDECEDTVLFRGMEPVTITAEEWRSEVFIVDTPGDVCEASGFYVYEDYLYMIENGEGLHLFDNADANNPRPVGFIPITGSQGLAARNDLLYVNQYTDLLTFDVSDPAKPTLVSRTEDVFGTQSVFLFQMNDGRFVTSFVPTEEFRTFDCSGPSGAFWDGNLLFAQGIDNSAQFDIASGFRGVQNSPGLTAGGGTPESVGQGGSLARFTIAQGNLYAVDDNSLRAFSLADPENPDFTATINLPWGVETIFPTADHLYIGTTTGMHIVGLDDPLNPEHLSTFSHVRACDPVVVSGNLAYITLWGGRDCGSIGDQLEIVDVTDARNPRSLQITPMDNSHGLGVAEGKLFLCNQVDGVTVYELDDRGLLGRTLDRRRDINARDVILLPADNRAIVLGYEQDGILQYDYADDGRLTEASRIAVCE